MRHIPYDPSRKSLYQPEAGTTFFMPGGRFSEDLVCAEVARLVYKRFERQDAALEEIRQALGYAGFSEMSFFAGEGSEALAACNAKTSTTLIAFRGSEQDPTDASFDFKGGPRNWPRGGKVHEAFYSAFSQIWRKIEPWIAARSGRLVFTGHSVGAAVATLAASIKMPMKLVTFGSPRVGNAEFVKTLGGAEILRYVDCCDIVTQLPPEIAGFSHCGNLRYIDQAGNIVNAPSAESVIEDRLRARVGYTFEYSWRIGSVAVRDLADHSPINYVFALQAANQEEHGAGSVEQGLRANGQ